MSDETISAVVRDKTGKALNEDNLLSALRIFTADFNEYVPCQAIGVFLASEEPPMITASLYDPVSTEFLGDFNARLLATDLETTGHDLSGKIASVAQGTPCDPSGPEQVSHFTPIPLKLEHEHLGWLAAASAAPLTSAQSDSLNEVSLFLPLVIRAFKRIREVSSRDELTGLFNRRRLEEELEQALNEASRLGQRVSILIADIDNMKEINDTHGHLTGDGILKEFAGLMMEHEREMDIIGRLGGDEFLAIMPGKGKDKAIELAERLISEVREHVFDPSGLSLRLRTSVGVATIARGSGGPAASDLLARADRALYQAKKNGGNNAVMGY